MKKKLLAIMLCAVLLTGVCATSFAARDIKSVLRLALSKHAQANEKNAGDFREIKRLLREAYQDFNKLSKSTFKVIENNREYKAIPSLLAELEKHSDGEGYRDWQDLFDNIKDKITNNARAVHVYIRQHYPRTFFKEPDFDIASGVTDKTGIANYIYMELIDRSHPYL